MFYNKRDTSATTPQTKKLPKAIVIGFRKCAAGTLPEHIQFHSHIAYSREQNFFNDNERYRRGLEWYRGNMPDSAWDAIGIERSLEYVYSPEAADRIKHLNSSMRLLLGICDPVKRVVVEYSHKLGEMMSKNQTFPDIEELVFDADGTVKEDYPWIKMSRYSNYLKPWFEHFPPEQFYFLNGDRFRDHPLSELHKFEKFMGLNSQITAVHLEDYRVMKNEQQVSSNTVRPHPAIKQATLDKLRAYFKPYNKELYKMLNQTFPW